jgi:hypothetical protein
MKTLAILILAVLVVASPSRLMSLVALSTMIAIAAANISQ